MIFQDSKLKRKDRLIIQEDIFVLASDVLQRPPYTSVYIHAKFHGLSVRGLGFAKCHPEQPGGWDMERGLQIARGRALANIARMIWQDPEIMGLQVWESIPHPGDNLSLLS